MWLDDIFAADHPFQKKVIERAAKSVGKGFLILEFGVFRGASLRRICAATKRIVRGFDSYEGLSEDWRPGYSRGALACEPPTGTMLPANARLIIGDIAVTLPEFLRRLPENKIGFAHFDLDTYTPTLAALNAIEHHLCKGSILLFDEIYDGKIDGDYNARHEQRAFREFIERTGLTFEFYGRRHEEAFAFRMV